MVHKQIHINKSIQQNQRQIYMKVNINQFIVQITRKHVYIGSKNNTLLLYPTNIPKTKLTRKAKNKRIGGHGLEFEISV